jgi:hypothetical protein
LNLNCSLTFCFLLQMTAEFNIDPTTITNSRIIDYKNDRAIVSFCVRFSVSDPARPGVIKNALDTPLAVAIEFKGFIGITEILGSDVDQYGVESFLCDSQNKELAAADILPKAQGGRIRVCVQPDASSRVADVVMKSINRFELQRGDVSQQILVANSVVKDPLLTDYVCTAGTSLCSVEATLDNGFFYSDGTVGGVGEALLQWSFNYGNRSVRRLIKVPIKPRQLQAPEPGGIVGSRSFTVSVKVEPASVEYEAEAFLCDKKNVALEKSNYPKLYKEAVRVCVRPNAAARAQGVFIREVASFRFQHDGTVQFAVETGGRQAGDGNTLLLCNPGDDICIFKTMLDSAFYKGNGKVDGTGEAYLQFGREGIITTRRAKIRGLQIANTDSAFAGASEVSFKFNVDPHFGGTEESWEAFWVESPVVLRTVYIAIAVLLFLMTLCCAFFVCFGLPCGHQKDEKKKLEKRFIVNEKAPPMMMPSKKSVRTNGSPGARSTVSEIPVSPIRIKEDEDEEGVILPLSRQKSKGSINKRRILEPRANSQKSVRTNGSPGARPTVSDIPVSPVPIKEDEDDEGVILPLSRQKSKGSINRRQILEPSERSGRSVVASPKKSTKGEPQNLVRQSTGPSRTRSLVEPSPKRNMDEPQNLMQITGPSRSSSMVEPQNSRQGVGVKSPKTGRRRQSNGGPNTNAGSLPFGNMGEPQN